MLMLQRRQLAREHSLSDSSDDADDVANDEYEKSRMKLVALHELVSQRLLQHQQQHADASASSPLLPPAPTIDQIALASDGDVSGAEEVAHVPPPAPVQHNRSHHKQGGPYNRQTTSAAATAPRRKSSSTSASRLTLSPAKRGARSHASATNNNATRSHVAPTRKNQAANAVISSSPPPRRNHVTKRSTADDSADDDGVGDDDDDASGNGDGIVDDRAELDGRWSATFAICFSRVLIVLDAAHRQGNKMNSCSTPYTLPGIFLCKAISVDTNTRID
jgi:hypothetical protein